MCAFTIAVLNAVLDVLARIVKKKEVKGIHIGGEGVKLSLFADDMILCV